MRAYFDPTLIAIAGLFWLLFFSLFMLANPIPAFGGSAQHIPQCVAQQQDAEIILNMLAQNLTPDQIKARAQGATDIGDARKADIFALVDEAAALPEPDPLWPAKVFERCISSGSNTRGD